MSDALARAKPISGIPAEACRKIVAIASDIDDTITTDGKIPPEAFAALWQAREAGLKVIPVTGRPAGWCDHIARMWPVDGVVGENGALWFRHVAGDPGRVKRHYVFEAAERAANRTRLEAVRDAILRAVPGAAVASDQAWREFDLAIDFCEDVPPLPDAAISRIVEVFESHGCTAKVSSIHVNGWFGRYDKLSMVKSFLKDELGVDADASRESVLFTGDSPNDEPMFSHFPVSVGMANIRDFASRVVHPPAYIASRRGGAGFAETIGILLSRR